MLAVPRCRALTANCGSGRTSTFCGPHVITEMCALEKFSQQKKKKTTTKNNKQPNKQDDKETNATRLEGGRASMLRRRGHLGALRRSRPAYQTEESERRQQQTALATRYVL